MEATLQEILAARDRRAEKQRALLARYEKPLICFTMNIPGPVKYDELVAEGFRLGCDELTAQLKAPGLPVLHEERLPYHTGCEAFFVVDAPAEKLKEITLAIEEGSALGRLFDMDVLTTDGRKLERAQERKCLLCRQSARVCGPRRTHSAEELRARATQVLQEAAQRAHSRAIGQLAARALLYEACTAPKPGLVDRLGCGSHQDMDIFSFMASAAALQPYFTDCALYGVEGKTFSQLRHLGRNAQAQMERATGGINTHKGAIFTMGLLSYAAGSLDREQRAQPEKVCGRVAALCEGLTAELAAVTPEHARTAGERLYAQYGITGIRGQAEQGFPAVLHTGLPVLQEGLALGYSLERAGCAALLAMLTATADTTLISRSDPQTAAAITRQVALLLAKERYPGTETLESLDEVFVSKNLSMGGTADLLAACYFLHFLQEQ